MQVIPPPISITDFPLKQHKRFANPQNQQKKTKNFRTLSIPFPCQFRQNQIELCHDENQDRVNKFQFHIREKNFSPI